MDLCAGPIFSKLQNGPIHNGRGRLGIYWDGSLTKRGSQDQVGGWWSPLIDKPLFLLWEVEKCGQCEKQVDEKCVGLRNGEKHCKAFDGCEDLLMGVKRADPSDCPNSCLASPVEDFLSNTHMDINSISTVLTWDLSISSLEMMKDHLVFIWAEAHYLKPRTFQHQDVLDFLMHTCSYSQVPNQVAISPAAHVTSYFTSESRIFKMRVRFRGVALAKKMVGIRYTVGYSMALNKLVVDAPSDIHTHPLVLVSRSRIHDCLCWERNLVSLLDVAVSQRPKCLIYVWCC